MCKYFNKVITLNSILLSSGASSSIFGFNFLDHDVSNIFVTFHCFWIKNIFLFNNTRFTVWLMIGLWDKIRVLVIDLLVDFVLVVWIVSVLHLFKQFKDYAQSIGLLYCEFGLLKLKL